MYNFHRGPNPRTERQKIWNLEGILAEWELVLNGMPRQEPPEPALESNEHARNLRSLLLAFRKLEQASSKRSARELFTHSCDLLEKGEVGWQSSRNDFLWGELFFRFGYALSRQGEAWLGSFAASLVSRALKLPSGNEMKLELPRLTEAKLWQRKNRLTGDWLRDRELLSGDSHQSTICRYLLTSDPAPVLAIARSSSPKEVAELRLLALYRGDSILLARLGKFSSLAKKAEEGSAIAQLHSLEALGDGKQAHPRDWLEFGECLAKFLARENSQTASLLALAFACRLATLKRQAALANFLFRSYCELAGEKRDPFGLLQHEMGGAIPSTFLARSSALLNLTRELALLFGKQRFEKVLRPGTRMHLTPLERQRLLELTAQEMTRLKGPVMKLGQMVTYVGTDLSSAERSLFDRLWQDAASIPFSALRAQLSASQLEKLETIDPEPLGCGSVSQVHRAVALDGRELALKILLPEMPEVMETDFQILRTLLPVARWLAPGVLLDAFYEEMASGLRQEIDFASEAASLRKLKQRFAGDPCIHIPSVHEDLSGPTTVAMSLERGLRFHEFVATASQEERDLAGQAIVRFVVQSVKEKFFNSDPHPGNYLFNGPRVTFLDFGAAATWDERTSAAWNGMILAFLYYDVDRFAEALKLVNGLSAHASREDIQQALDFFAKPQEGFWNTGRVGTLDPDISVKQIHGLAKSFSGRHMPVRLYPKFLFGMRVYLGHIHLVARIGARANWKEIVEKIFTS